MKMKIPSSNSIGNGYYNYGDTYFLDNSENGTPNNSNSIEECDSPTTDGDFSEYLWMENEEEFDKEVNTIFILFINFSICFVAKYMF